MGQSETRSGSEGEVSSAQGRNRLAAVRLPVSFQTMSRSLRGSMLAERTRKGLRGGSRREDSEGMFHVTL